MSNIAIWYTTNLLDEITGAPLAERRFTRVVRSIGFDSDLATPDILDRIWRDMNVVEGDEAPVRLGCRSMSMGDAVVIGEWAYICAATGWYMVAARDLDLLE